MRYEEREGLAELVDRLAASAINVHRFTPEAICKDRPAQLALCQDTSRNVIVCAGRGGGKTYGAAFMLLWLGLRAKSGQNGVYIGATVAAVKKMAWKPLLELNRLYELGGTPNYADLSMVLPNGATIYLMGVDSEKMADKARGIHNVYLAVLDECQRYALDVMTTLRRDVLRPMLRDIPGILWLAGTPSKSGPVGMWWDLWESPEYSHHTWTIYDFQGMTKEQIDEIVNEDLKAEHETREGAWFQREYLARWVVDTASRVYHFDDARNVYDPEELAGDDDLPHCVWGVDLGVGDADAIAELAWGDTRGVFLRWSDVQTGQTVDALARKLAARWEVTQPFKVVVDAGGGGKKTLISLQELLPDMPLEAADKPLVKLQVRELNNLLESGRLRVPRGSRFCTDVRLAGWVDGIVGVKIDESGKRHSDLVPAVRYAVRAATPFLPEDRPEPTREAQLAAREGAAYRDRLAKAAKLGGYRGDPDDWNDGDVPGLGIEE